MRKKQKLKTFDSSFFIGKDFFGDDDFENVGWDITQYLVCWF